MPLLGSILVAAFVCSIVADLIFESQGGSAINDWVKGLFSGMGGDLNSNVITDNGKLYLMTQDGNVSMAEVLKNNGFGAFSGTVEAIISYVKTFDGTQSMADAFVPSITLIICYVIAFAALFLASFIVIGLLNKLIGKLIRKKLFKYADKFLGAIFWTAFVVFLIYGALALLKLFETESILQPFIDYLKQSAVARIMYENNIFVILLNEIAKSFGLVS